MSASIARRIARIAVYAYGGVIMDYEKKYKEALSRARQFSEHPLQEDSDSIVEYIFPELKESEDEKVRKHIISVLEDCWQTCKNIDYDSSRIQEDIAWLEKQGDKSVNIDIESMVSSYEQRLLSQGGIENSPLVNMCLSAFKQGVENVLEELNLKKLEKQGEQTLPQTNERAWLYLVADVLTWKDGIGQYLDDPRVQELTKKLCSEYAQKLYNPSVLSNSSNTGNNNQEPIDKFEPRFKVGDWVVVSTSEGDRVVQIDSVEYCKDGYPSYFTTGGRWFGNETKARLLTDKDVETITLSESKVIVNQKPTVWSEEDEKMFDSSVDNLAELMHRYGKEYGNVGKCIEWLKSIKQRIK